MYDIHLVHAYLQIKKAYALANRSQGKIEAPVCRAIMQASDEILSQKYEIKFAPEPLPSVSGITLNTSINEAIATRAEEILGGKPGQYQLVNPDDHVNLSQEITPLFGLSARLAILLAVVELETHLLKLERLLLRESLTLARVLKFNFTTADQNTTAEWGKRLNVFATATETVVKRLKESANELTDQEHDTFKGASANIDQLVLGHLAEITGFRLKEPDHVWQNTFIISDLSLIASALKDLALILSKLASVAKMVNSVTLNDIADASKMKNAADLLADSIKMTACQAISQNLSFTFLAQNEQLEGHLLMPLLSENLLGTIHILQTAIFTFTEKGFYLQGNAWEVYYRGMRLLVIR